MADLEDALRARAVAHSGLNALLGGRFYPNELPQKPTLPACAYLRVGTVPFHTGAGGSALRVGRVRFVVYGGTYDAAKDVVVQLRAAFHRWGGTVAGVTVQQGFLDTEFDLGFDATTNQWVTSIDLRFWYLEP